MRRGGVFWHAQGAAACVPELGTQKVPALPIGSKLGEYPCMACITWSMGHVAMAIATTTTPSLLCLAGRLGTSRVTKRPPIYRVMLRRYWLLVALRLRLPFTALHESTITPKRVHGCAADNDNYNKREYVVAVLIKVRRASELIK